MEILYQDQKIIVCVKPAGILSTDQPGGLPDLLRHALGNPDEPLYTVHRLDQATGGVILLARTRRAASELGQQMASHQVQKQYWTVVHGAPSETSGNLHDLLFHDRQKRISYVVSSPSKGVQEAVLHYEILNTRDGLSLLKISLQTGRTHQIRVQLSSRGLHLVGDRKYGNPEETCGLALWSHELNFFHPKSGTLLSFSASPPQRWPWTLFL